MEIVAEVLLDAVLDTLKLVPFLFLAFLAMEFIEHKAGEKMEAFLGRAGRLGPVLGAGLGLVPQCGFSTAAAGLFAARVIPVGTVVAVFLATSDEMIPVMLGGQVPGRIILIALAVKFAVACAAGFAAAGLSVLWHRYIGEREGRTEHIHDLCEVENCHCERGIFHSALVHTGHITLFLFLVELVLGALFAWVGDEGIRTFAAGHGILTYFASALVGLLPNCAASVVLTDLYAQGILSFGGMMAGLLPGAGAGLLVLLRQRRPIWQAVALVAALFAVGVFSGGMLDLLGWGAL